MTENFSNNLFMKKKLYNLWMKKDMSILQHLNAFNRILSDLLNLKVKLEEEDKDLLLLYSFPSNYDHLATNIKYGKKTLKLEDIRHMLQNELMKKMDFTEEVIEAKSAKKNKI